MPTATIEVVRTQRPLTPEEQTITSAQGMNVFRVRNASNPDVGYHDEIYAYYADEEAVRSGGKLARREGSAIVRLSDGSALHMSIVKESGKTTT